MRISSRFTTVCTTSALLALLSGCAIVPISRPNPFVHPDPFSLGEAPFVQTDPLMDGKATSREEWANGVRLPDIFYAGPTARAGFYYFESRESWQATSVRTGATMTYPGHTQFIAHDLVGSSDPTSILYHFQLDEDHDWNSFSVVTPSGNVTIWVFDDQDDPDDSDWLPAAEGLDRSRFLAASKTPVSIRILKTLFHTRYTRSPPTILNPVIAASSRTAAQRHRMTIPGAFGGSG